MTDTTVGRSLVDRFSTIPTDPLRGFRFYATFSPASSASDTFDTRIKDASGAASWDVPAQQILGGTSNGFVGGFTQIGGLQISVANIMYREGGMNTSPHQMPGQTSFTPVTFQRGVLFGNDQEMTWLRGLYSAQSGMGMGVSVNKTFRLDITIYVAAHVGSHADTNVPRIGFRLKNAWITNLNYSDLNAGGNDLLFETMTVVHEGLIPFFSDSLGNPLKSSGITA